MLDLRWLRSLSLVVVDVVVFVVFVVVVRLVVATVALVGDDARIAKCAAEMVTVAARRASLTKPADRPVNRRC